MTSLATVLVTSRSFSSGARDLRAELDRAGCSVVSGPPDHDLLVLRPLLAECSAWIAGTGAVTADHLDAAPQLRVVARYGVGTDAVDLDAARERHVMVTNTPGANTDAVADLTLALLLSGLRGVTAGDAAVRDGDWSSWRGRELGPMTVGVLGFGRIGRAVVRRLSGFGCDVVVHDPFVAAEAVTAAGARAGTLAELGQCDAVTVHAPGGTTVIDDPWLQDVAPGVVLVNTARADVVDEAALAAALRDGRIAAYAADTLANEHGRGGDPDGAGPLLAPDLRSRTVFTPHLGANTVEAVDAMGSGAVTAVIDVLQERTPQDVVVGPRSEEEW